MNDSGQVVEGKGKKEEFRLLAEQFSNSAAIDPHAAILDCSQRSSHPRKRLLPEWRHCHALMAATGFRSIGRAYRRCSSRLGRPQCRIPLYLIRDPRSSIYVSVSRSPQVFAILSFPHTHVSDPMFTHIKHDSSLRASASPSFPSLASASTSPFSAHAGSPETHSSRSTRT